MKRIAVPVSNELYDACTTLAGVSGGGRGRVLAEVLTEIEPMLIAAAAGYQAAERFHGEQRSAMAARLDKVQGQLNDALASLPDSARDQLFASLGAMGSVLADIQNGPTEAAPEGGDKTATAADAAGTARSTDAEARPPHTNRGVHSEI